MNPSFGAPFRSDPNPHPDPHPNPHPNPNPYQERRRKEEEAEAKKRAADAQLQSSALLFAEQMAAKVTALVSGALVVSGAIVVSVASHAPPPRAPRSSRPRRRRRRPRRPRRKVPCPCRRGRHPVRTSRPPCRRSLPPAWRPPPRAGSPQGSPAPSGRSMRSTVPRWRSRPNAPPEQMARSETRLHMERQKRTLRRRAACAHPADLGCWMSHWAHWYAEAGGSFFRTVSRFGSRSRGVPRPGRTFPR